MLDVREYDSLIDASARVAALAAVTDTTARAIQAVIEGRGGHLGRRTMSAVTEFVDVLERLRGRSIPTIEADAPGFSGSDDLTSGVGKLIADEQWSGLDSGEISTLLGLSVVVRVDTESGRLVVDDIEKGRELSELLLEMGRVLSESSAARYANSHSAYRE